VRSRSVLAIAVAGCAADDAGPARCPLGDPRAPAELEIVHLDANLELATTAPGARVPLIQPPQGTWIVFLGARARNLDGCRVDLTTSFRDGAGGPIVKVDRRPTQLDDTGDGWAITRSTLAGNLQICPQLTATRDLHDEPYEITVTLEDAYGQRASRSIGIVPVCPDPDATGRCLCECDRDYVVGGACPGTAIAPRWSLEHDMAVRRLGGGPELVWLHGLGDTSASVDAIASHPSLAGFTHVLPDLPGYGRSPWPAEPSTVEELGASLARWIGDRAPVVIGHSLGGVLATLIAERTRVRAVVNVEGNLSPGDCTFSAQATAYSLDAFTGGGFDAIRDATYRRGVTELPLRAYHAGLTVASPRTFHRHAEGLVAMSADEQLAARWAGLAVPALYVAGAPGGISARSLELLEHHGVRRLVYEPAGHWPHVDHVARFAGDVAAFLASAP
jgi:pimeloyl-ACP methyl ester carboxylesterase